MPDVLEHCRIAVLAAERDSWIAGQRAHAREYEDAGEEDDNQGGPGPSEHEAAHDRLLPTLAYVAYPAN